MAKEQEQQEPEAQSSADSSTPSPSASSNSMPAPTPDGSKANTEAMQNLAGMGITVVLRNRNHIRTIQDKSAEEKIKKLRRNG